MEEILLNRLSAFVANIKSLSDKAVALCSCEKFKDNELEEAKITVSKLQSILTRFTTELYQYFNMSVNPNADEVSNFTSEQLVAENSLAELKSKIESSKSEQRPVQNVNINRSKLPELHLPSFKGDVLEWHQFWDQFSSNIDQRNIHDVDKLLYLKMSVTGEAKRVIDGLNATNNNYQIAINLLKERYGKGVQVIDAHHSKLRKLKSAESLGDCRRTLNDIESHLRVLESLGEDVNNNHLRSLIMEKFPEEIIYQMKIKMTTNSVQEMRKHLDFVITAREETKHQNEGDSYTAAALHITAGKPKRFSNAPKVKENNQWNKPSTSNSKFLPFPKKREHEKKPEYKPGNDKFNNKRRKISCIFCQEEHFNDECSKFKTVGERKQKLNNRCFNCFQLGHRVKSCKLKTKCVHCGKHGSHNRALCPTKFNKREEHTKTLYAVNTGSTVLQTAVVNVAGPAGNIMKCRILLDSGSQRSYITQKIAKDLNLKTEEENRLFIFTFGSTKPHELNSPLVKIELQTKDNIMKPLFVNIVPTITHGIAYPKLDLIGWENEGDIKFADDGSLQDRIDILIGNDYYYSLMLTKKIQIQENLYLVDSELGWILSGKIENEDKDDILSVVTYFQSSCKMRLNEPDPPLDHGNLKYLWELESIGITDSPKVNRDEEAIKHFNENTELQDNRYFVSWPWNEYPPDLTTNFGLAYGRLVSLLKRLDSTTLSAYSETLKDQLDKGIIEIVPEEDDTDHPIHYLPHHGVSTPGKTLRIVYDASAKTKSSKSLNECLYCGPMMLEDLTGLLIKFRSYAIGLVADVEKAFLQIGLKNKDRDVTRFLWLKDITKPATEDNLLHYRFTRVPFGIISSPFLLNATIKHHLQNSENENIRKLSSEIYVDNVLTGSNTTKEALKLYKDSKGAFQEISMNLRDWSSNSEEIMCSIPDVSVNETVKVLGLDWDLKKDTLRLRFKNPSTETQTKRGVLKVIASVYDPCGYAAPYVLAAKLFLQELWKSKIKWDSPLSKDLSDKWTEIRKELDEIKEISVSRCYMMRPECSPQEDHYELHCFTDASLKAYSACIFLINGSTKSFVIGKSRLVPVKDKDNLKIPRLELLGVLIGSRLMKYVVKFLPHNITKHVLWTDSQIVIEWCKSDKLLPPFVARRIEEIKKNRILDIRYVPSELNPADVGTKPSSKEDKRKWLEGPQFLIENPDMWPSTFNTCLFSAGEDLSRSDNSKQEEEMEQESIPEENYQESHEEEFRNTGLDQITSDDPNTDNNTKSKVQQIKHIQAESFSDEIKGKKTHLSRNLGLFVDVDGLLRCDGRLTHSDLSYEAKHPILLPKDSDFTFNIIKETHEKNYHVGVPHTLNIVRQQYWVPQGRSQVQKVIRKCPKCVKHGGGPYALPKTPALPAERVKYTSPFTYVGVDYFGPMYVTSDNGKRKIWVCLFTCLVIRAIHMEIVNDLSAEECLMAFRRFIACRGSPTLIVSDNATQFKLLSEVITSDGLSQEQIKWKFIPQLAPWHGGVYERLIGQVKHCMKRTLQKHLLNHNQLLTIVKEVEAVVNTRPLTYVGTDLDHVLKPADFLSPGKCLNIKPTDQVLSSATTTKQQLLEGWKRGKTIIQEYREMFINQYLLSLRERYSLTPKQPRVKAHEEPCVGSVVQIKNDSRNRENWKVGRIVELIKGADGQCRIAKVKVNDTILTRSIGHLYPLEVDETEQQGSISHNKTKFQETSNKDIMDIEENMDTPIIIAEEVTKLQPEIRTDEISKDMDVTDMNTDTEIAKVSEQSIDTVDMTNENMDMPHNEIDDDSIRDNEPVIEQSAENVEHHRRAAAVRALDKIKEWTQHLMMVLH